MTRFTRLAIVLGAALAVTVGVATAAPPDEPPVEHITVLAGEGYTSVARRICPHAVSAATNDLRSSNGFVSLFPGQVLHYHPAACPAPSTSTTTVASTSSTSTTVPAVTSTTSTTSTTTTSTAPSTTSSSTTSPPVTTTIPPGGGFTASFATPGDFYDRFWTYTGNYCEPVRDNQDFRDECRPCERGVGTCSYLGDHDMACSAPVTQRTVHPDNHNENFWWCAPNGPDTGHVMTAMSVGGYSISGFTPNRAFTDIRRICWDQNLTDLGGGKWLVVSLIPASVLTSHRNPNVDPDTHQPREGEGPYRLDYTIPEFDADNGPGDFNLQRMERLQFKLFKNQLSLFDRLGSFSGGGGLDWATTGGFVAGDDVASRFQICLTENASGIVVSQARPGGVSTWQSDVRFPDGPVYVVWADDTYDDVKHGGTIHKTWHLDNLIIDGG